MAHIKYPTKSRYSKNFTRKELDCKCGCATPPRIQKRLRRLAIQLEKFRKIHGKPIGILSGYRCPSYNRKVGGAIDSMHLYGYAADIRVPRGQQKKYVAVAKKVYQFRRGGIGVYANGGLHVDCRGILGRVAARWNSWRGQRR